MNQNILINNWLISITSFELVTNARTILHFCLQIITVHYLVCLKIRQLRMS